MTEAEHTPPDEYYAREERPDRPRRTRETRGGSGGGALLAQQRVRIGALIAVLIAAGFIIWAVAGGSSSKSPSSSPSGAQAVAGTPPVALSSGGLKTLAAALHQSIYWLGSGPSSTYELRQLQNGYVYVRYLPHGVKAGDPRAFLTVGTYPMQNAYSVTQGLAKSSGAAPLDPGHGGVALSSKANGTDAYVAFPGSNYQIEVYSPTPGRASSFVTSGAVTPVPSSNVAKPGVRAITAAGLKSLSRSLGQPIYWAGLQPSTSLELTQTSSGRLYVRYLPKGTSVGDKGTYLTVATYPVTSAYSVTKALGAISGNTSFRAHGAITAANKSTTAENIYVAYPGTDYQVEVFSPTAGTARQLAKAGKIVPVG